MCDAVEGDRTVNLPFDVHETIEKDHGRIETRRYLSIAAVDWLPGKEEWRDLQSVGMVIATRDVNGVVTKAVRYYLSSLADLARGLWPKPCAGIGALRIRAIGYWTWSFEKMTVGSGQAMQQRTWDWCGGWPIVFYNKKRRPRSELKINGSKPRAAQSIC